MIDDLGASLAEQLQSEGRDVSYYHHDVTSRAGWEAVVASVQQAHGPIDVLVNDAGVQVRLTGIEADDREWDLWERGGRHESVFGQRAESGRGHVGVRAILQVVNQVQQYERVPFLAADLEIPSTGSRFFDGNQTRTSCAGYPYGQGRILFSRQRRRAVAESGHFRVLATWQSDVVALSLITVVRRGTSVRERRAMPAVS
jgi:hypothetical protein